MRNLLLIGVNAKYTHSNLAIRYMRAYADVPIFECTINDDIFSVYRKLSESNATYFCFSTYIWNAEYIFRLCAMLTAVRPNIKIILGGPEAGYNAQALFDTRPWLFGIIRGEGEDAVKALKSGADFAAVPNFSYRKGNTVYETKTQKTNLAALVFPYTAEDLKQELQNRILYFETARGCLFHCTYCLSSSEGETRFFPMEYVKQGLLFFMENRVPLVKLVDRTFNENNDRATEIVSFILEHNQCTRFHFEIAPQLLTDAFIERCAQAPDFFQFEMGIQTTNQATMRAIRRPYVPQETAKKIKKIPKTIHQHLDLIAGLPLETLDTFKKGFNFVYALQPHMLQLGFLKLLKHTAIMQDAEKYGIQTTAFAPFEVLATATMSAEDIILLKKTEQAVDRIYNSGAFCETLKQLQPQDPFSFYAELGTALYQAEYHAPLSKSDLYVFMYKKFPLCKKSLVLDFLKTNHKAKLPEIFTNNFAQAKLLHKKLAALPQFHQKKFHLVFAAESVFCLTENEITELDPKQIAILLSPEPCL